jgi:hypothetical protein
VIDVLLKSLPADAQARVCGSHEWAYWHGCHGLGARTRYEGLVLRLIEDEMDKMETARRERDRIIDLLREGDVS